MPARRNAVSWRDREDFTTWLMPRRSSWCNDITHCRGDTMIVSPGPPSSLARTRIDGPSAGASFNMKTGESLNSKFLTARLIFALLDQKGAVACEVGVQRR